MLKAGEVVSGYRIERVLGSGGMGMVYLAANPTLPRLDALKVASAELSLDPDFRARFAREADVASRLDHPQIVSVYNRGESADGRLWIAMQFVDGTDADAALRAGTMTAPRAVHIITEVAKALDFAHSHNVIHRDIKPANFMLAGPTDAGERVLLGDFGIARALDDVGLTATGSVMATVDYAAPEVLGGMPFDGRADIYSLGCALFRLLTGKTPFRGTNGPAAVIMAHLQKPPPRVTDLNPSLPRAFDDVIRIAMAKNPAARFPSAIALAHAAQAALTDSTAAMRAPVPTTDVNAHQSDFAATAPAWWGPEGPRAALAAPAPPPPPPRRRRLAIAGVAGAVLVAGGTTAAVVASRPDSPSAAPSQSAGTAPQTEQAPSPTGAPATDVPASALRSILLTASEIPGNTGDTAVVLERDGTELLDDAVQLENAGCVGAWQAAQQTSYASSSVTGAAVQSLRAIGQSATTRSVTQAVLSFRSQLTALNALQTVRRQFEICGGKPITITAAGHEPQAWAFGQPVTVSGSVTLTATPTGGTGSCQHGISARGNVLIDIRQCMPAGPNNVAALVAATAAKVPRQ